MFCFWQEADGTLVGKKEEGRRKKEEGGGKGKGERELGTRN
jgi:hypothetical protein